MKIWSRFLLLFCILTWWWLPANQSEAAEQSLTPQETWVLKQMVDGREADLKKHFGEKEEDRVLSAHFLEDLITGGYKVHWKGVKIKNAVISDGFDLERAEIPQDVELVDCKFKEKVICLQTVFEKNFSISGSYFEKEGNFEQVNVKKNFFSVSSIFQGPVNFSRADIGKQFNAEGAQFKNEKENADFGGLRVGQDAFFRGAVFQGPVDFVGANIGRQFAAEGTQFQSEKENAIFNSFKVGQNALFLNVIFKGPVDFTTAEIGGQFAANGVQFLSQEKMIKFNAMKVGDAFFENAIFKGPVDFSNVEIGRQLSAKGAQFLNKEHLANFNALRVGQIATFKDAIFYGPVDFVGADIGGQFIADGAQFLNPEKEVIFAYMKVGTSVFFNKATFLGKVYFDSADIGWNFSAEETQFLNKDKSADFKGIRVGKEAFLENSSFKGNIDLGYGNYLDLRLKGTKNEKLERGIGLSLKGTMVQRELRLENFKLTTLEAQHLRIKGPGTFEELAIQDSADFQNATIENLRFKNISWPEKKENLKIDGLTYHSLCVNQPDNFSELLGLVERSAFNTQNYMQLEDYFKHSGHKDWADKTYIHLKDRELEKRNWYESWFVWFFWGLLAGYGRYPSRTLILSIGIILIGATFRFNPKYLNIEYTKQWHLNYKMTFLDLVKNDGFINKLKEFEMLIKLWLLRLITSFDQFIPAINLGLAKNWQPSELSFWGWVYLYFQKISGWILVPIWLAAIYSQFK